MNMSFKMAVEFNSSKECEQFQLMVFGISCALCARTDQQCPWHRDLEQNNQSALAAVAS
jgi:hypothetical protein